MTTLDGVIIIEGPDYVGRSYWGAYFLRENEDGPGWYIYQYSDSDRWLYRLAARPDVKPRRCPLWNIPTRRGWRTKREARAILRLLEARDAAAAAA